MWLQCNKNIYKRKYMLEPNIIYEDNHVIVVIKPHNVSVQEDESKDLDMLTIIKDFLKKRDNKPIRFVAST